MKKVLALLVLITIFCGCESNEDIYLFDEKLPESKNSSFYLDLAYQHAPVHYQDVDRTGSHGLS